MELNKGCLSMQKIRVLLKQEQGLKVELCLSDVIKKGVN